MRLVNEIVSGKVMNLDGLSRPAESNPILNEKNAIEP